MGLHRLINVLFLLAPLCKVMKLAMGHESKMLMRNHQGAISLSSPHSFASSPVRTHPSQLPNVMETQTHNNHTLYEMLSQLCVQYNGCEGHTGEIRQEQLDMNQLVDNAKVQTICETGFNDGHSSLRWLLQSHPAAHVYSFDIGMHTYSKHAAQLLQKHFPERLTVTWGDSTQTVPKFFAEHPSVKCNLVFVDGGHRVDIARADLRNFAAVVDPTYHKVMIDDVACTAGYCEGPQQAWSELVANGAVVQGFIKNTAAGTGDPARRGWAVGHFTKSHW